MEVITSYTHPSHILYPFLSHLIPIPLTSYTHPSHILYPFLSHLIPIPLTSYTHSSHILYPFLSHLIPIPLTSYTHPLPCPPQVPLIGQTPTEWTWVWTVDWRNRKFGYQLQMSHCGSQRKYRMVRPFWMSYIVLPFFNQIHSSSSRHLLSVE